MRKINLLKKLKNGILFSLLGMTTYASAQSGACNLIIDADFNNRQGNELYTIAKADQDFGKIRAMTSGEIRGLTSAFPHRTRTVNGVLRAEYLKDDASGRAGGFLFDREFTPTDEAVLEYKVKFEKGFVWATGGKLPGLGGTSRSNNGAIPSGCRYNTDGWSARLMWRRNRAQTNTPYLILYSYFAQKQDGGSRVDGDCGDGKRIFTGLKTDKWYTIRQYIKMNTPGKNDGVVVMWIDGQETYRDNKAKIRNSGKSNLKINALIMNTYRGGSRTDPVWHSPTTDHAQFDDFKVWTNCSDPGNSTPTPNNKPSLSITSPSNGATITAGSTVSVNINATDSDGSIVEHKVFVNGQLEDTDGSSYTAHQITNIQPGTYTIRVDVKDNKGAVTTKSVTISVASSQPKDCAGVPGGSATTVCGVCVGGSTGKSAPDADGDGIVDCDDECPNDASNTCNDPVNQAPSLSFTKPANGDSFDEGVTLISNVAVSDDGEIANVKLYFNGSLVRQENFAPYDWNHNGQDPVFDNMAAGTYTLKAVATDDGGLTGETSITITVKSPLPKDCAGVSGGSATTVCGVCVGGTTGKSAPDADGDGIVDCEDECPNDASNTCNDPSNQAPSVSFTKPVNGDTYEEGVTLVANVAATDDGEVDNVKLYLNGSLVRQENVSPYDWNHKGQDPVLQNMSAGTYTLKAVAIDDDGATTEKSITITVNKKVVTPPNADPIIGDDCAVKNGTANFELNEDLQKNATGYSWWFSGSSSSVISPANAPETVTVTMSQYYKGGEVCVGVNLNHAPYYTSYCKAVGVCSAAEEIESQEIEVNEYPNPVNGNSLTVEVDENAGEILEVTILSTTGDVLFDTNSLVSGGQIDLSAVPAGSHILRVVTEGGVVNKRILKL